MDAIKSELSTLAFQGDIMRIWIHIKLSPFYYKANTLTETYTPTRYCLSITTTELYL